ncbi:hypothetical protein [uncultured Winogradskyella sp.]|uniref:hypothetical protein n=1 Tax=Winogradskyella sp. 4-2091 TaxID=3381659 RepID=UPI0026246F6D|nr:hypothetical protein [uncultured Winogradskyella sp.]
MSLYRILFFSILFLSLGCSSSDDSSSNGALDVRYKVLFSYDGDVVFIGDQSNEVIKKIYSQNSILGILGYYNNENTNEIFFITRNDFSNNVTLNKINLSELFSSEEYYYTPQQSIITFNENEDLISEIYFESESRFHAIFGLSDYNAVLKTFENGSEVLERNITANFGMDRYGIEFSTFFEDDTLILMESVFNSSLKRIKLVDLNSFTLISENTNFSFNFFQGFGNSTGKYIIGRKIINYETHEYLANIQGNILYDITDGYSFLGHSSIGYDEADNAFEYFDRGDGRNETGVINTNNGEVTKTNIAGEPNFRSSPVFYFIPN